MNERLKSLCFDASSTAVEDALQGEVRMKKRPKPRKGGLRGRDKALADLEHLDLPPEEVEAARRGYSGREGEDTATYALQVSSHLLATEL